MSATIFISRELTDDNHLVLSLASHGYKLIAEPMICTEGIDFEPKEFRSGWIFFSSKQGVHHFFERDPDIGKCELAAIGEGTARLLRKYGEVSFVGSVPDTAEVARAFRAVVGRKKCWFPISELSVRTVQQALPASQVNDIICYRTVENPRPVGHPDILVFSSPSNVDAFLKVNAILPIQKVIAFGKTTAAALTRHGFDQVVVSRGTSDAALLDAIKTVQES